MPWRRRLQPILQPLFQIYVRFSRGMTLGVRGAVVNGPRFFEQPTCHWRPSVEGGVLAGESSAMLKAFFRARRG